MWYQEITDSWQAITTGVSASSVSGQYGAQRRISFITLTVTMDMYNRRYKCQSVYGPAGKETKFTAVTTLNVEGKWHN
jgi:hypothetical protein